MFSVLFAVYFAVIITALGWYVIDKLDHASRLSGLERVSTSFVLGCFVPYIWIHIVGEFRLDTISIWTLVALCTLGAILGLRLIPWGRYLAAARSEIASFSGNLWLAFLWLAVSGIAITSFLQGLAPPNDYDSLHYHLAFPRLDVEMGRNVLSLRTEWFGSFLPALGSHLTRLALVVADGGLAQLLHGIFGLLGGVAAAALSFRMGYGKKTALAAAILFLSSRIALWQMGTVETDAAVASLAGMSLVLYLIARVENDNRLDILFGLMIGLTILMKYNGIAVSLCIGALIVFDVATGKRPLRFAFIGPLAAFVLLVPHFWQDS